MKQRLISSAVGLLLFGIVLHFLGSWVFNLAVATVSVLAIWELNRAVFKGACRSMVVMCSLPAISLLFFKVFKSYPLPFCFIYLLFVCFCLLFSRKVVTVQKGLFVFAASLGLSFSFFSLVCLRDALPEKSRLLWILLVFASAWVTDTCAYLVGISVGKHSFFQDVSPKKTWEGVAGGVFGSVACGVVMYLGFGEAYGFPVVGIFRLMVFLSVASGLAVFGDLFASLVKRQSDIKDFGTIMPGHGGVLDRLDSLIFVAPYFYLVASVIK
ncbi:MAG: phosphatidate cytidylyltransferase [Oscillospiraceae bacterium]|nr:phosphatidate cytidylyltransferase [Oscillospiraceae bacterium]